MFTPFHAGATEPNVPLASDRRAFTLVELLVAMTVLLILILAMVGLTNQANGIWRTSRARITAFQGARAAFERITTNLNQATLNTYLDYYNSAGLSRSDAASAGGANSDQALGSFVPSTYDRASELQFVCGQSATLIPNANAVRPTQALFFECPIGHVSDPVSGASTTSNGSTSNDFKNLTRTLNAVGYYIQFLNENDPQLGLLPGFVTTPPASWRYRLMELNQPSQNLSIYASKQYLNPGSWFSLAVDPGTGSSSGPVYDTADNVVALIVRPKVANPTTAAPNPTEIAPTYAYDTKQYLNAGSDTYAKMSKNQLPPLVQITLVAIDADSATRLAKRYGATAPPLVNNGLFTNVQSYGSDLDPNNSNSLLSTLKTNNLNYRVFVTDVTVPGAKWSQTN